jgi:hypothetical protein
MSNISNNKTKLIFAICCIVIFILPFLMFWSGSAISLPGFACTPSFSGNIVDKRGKPVPGTYILYNYQGWAQGIVTHPSYSLPAAIVVTDTNGKFTIPSLFQHKDLFATRAKLATIVIYSPVTHSHSYFDDPEGRNDHTVSLPDNTHDLNAWADSLNRVEFALSCMRPDDLGIQALSRNQEDFSALNAMLQSEHRLLDERKK